MGGPLCTFVSTPSTVVLVKVWLLDSVTQRYIDMWVFERTDGLIYLHLLLFLRSVYNTMGPIDRANAGAASFQNVQH